MQSYCDESDGQRQCMTKVERPDSSVAMVTALTRHLFSEMCHRFQLFYCSPSQTTLINQNKKLVPWHLLIFSHYSEYFYDNFDISWLFKFLYYFPNFLTARYPVFAFYSLIRACIISQFIFIHTIVVMEAKLSLTSTTSEKRKNARASPRPLSPSLSSVRSQRVMKLRWDDTRCGCNSKMVINNQI